jgi:hypothetical protein
MGKTSTASKRKYNEKAYDRISLSVPKGKKDEFKKVAEQKGMSLNGMILEALEKFINE